MIKEAYLIKYKNDAPSENLSITHKIKIVIVSVDAEKHLMEFNIFLSLFF